MDSIEVACNLCASVSKVHVSRFANKQPQTGSKESLLSCDSRIKLNRNSIISKANISVVSVDHERFSNSIGVIQKQRQYWPKEAHGHPVITIRLVSIVVKAFLN